MKRSNAAMKYSMLKPYCFLYIFTIIRHLNNWYWHWKKRPRNRFEWYASFNGAYVHIQSVPNNNFRRVSGTACIYKNQHAIIHVLRKSHWSQHSFIKSPQIFITFFSFFVCDSTNRFKVRAGHILPHQGLIQEEKRLRWLGSGIRLNEQQQLRTETRVDQLFAVVSRAIPTVAFDGKGLTHCWPITRKFVLC